MSWSISVPAHLSKNDWNSFRYLSIICSRWTGPFLYQLTWNFSVTNFAVGELAKNWHFSLAIFFSLRFLNSPQLMVKHALCMWSPHRRHPCSDASNFSARYIGNLFALIFISLLFCQFHCQLICTYFHLFRYSLLFCQIHCELIWFLSEVVYFSVIYIVSLFSLVFNFLIFILLCVDKCLLLLNFWLVLEKAKISQFR